MNDFEKKNWAQGEPFPEGPLDLLVVVTDKRPGPPDGLVFIQYILCNCVCLSIQRSPTIILINSALDAPLTLKGLLHLFHKIR